MYQFMRCSTAFPLFLQFRRFVCFVLFCGSATTTNKNKNPVNRSVPCAARPWHTYASGSRPRPDSGRCCYAAPFSSSLRRRFGYFAIETGWVIIVTLIVIKVTQPYKTWVPTVILVGGVLTKGGGLSRQHHPRRFYLFLSGGGKGVDCSSIGNAKGKEKGEECNRDLHAHPGDVPHDSPPQRPLDCSCFVTQNAGFGCPFRPPTLSLLRCTGVVRS